MMRIVPIVLFYALLSQGAFAQGSAGDYERVEKFRELTSGKVFRTKVEPKWIGGGSRFWYRVQTGADAFEFVLVDAEKGERRAAFDHGKLAVALAKVAGSEVASGNLPVRGLEFSSEAATYDAFGKRWETNLASYETRQLAAAGKEAGTVKVLDELRPSRVQGADTEIRFANRTGGSVSLFWFDRNSERVSYGTLDAGKERAQHTFAGHVWIARLDDGKEMAFEAAEAGGTAIIDGSRLAKRKRNRSRRSANRSRRASIGPDGKWEAFIENHNVHMRNQEDGESAGLSSGGTEDDPFVGRFAWSPDSRYFAAIQEKRGVERTVHFVEAAPKDQLQPKLHSLTYAKPGDQLPVARPRLFDVENYREIALSEELFSNAWSISEVRWLPDSSAFTFLYNQRGHQVMRIVSIDAKTGRARAIVDEECATFFDYAYKRFSEYLDETGELIWMSERDGWNHLYLYDAQKGAVKNQITKGDWVVGGVERVDRDKREIWFRASGIYPEQDPYYIHLCRVGFDGSGLTILTEGDGTHRWEFSPGGDYLIDRWSRVDHPPVTELRKVADGKLVCVLETGDWTQLVETGWQVPERFVAKARDGKTDIHGVIYRPTDFDPAKRYPVIEAIYAGPHGSFVPKDFSPARGYHANAELGFIMVKIDGMGTSNRSKAFHDIAWKNVGDSGFPDRILWMKAAANKYPSMDLERVGLYGGSAGGQSTLRALLAHGDFYKVGVADCGCHDNRMDKVWWNELWMGWPIGEHYAEQSNVTQAHRLTGKLMLTVGAMDRNVDPASTMQVVEALIQADKDFDLIVFPSSGHGIGSGKYGTRRMRDFFVRHLHGREPRW